MFVETSVIRCVHPRTSNLIAVDGVSYQRRARLQCVLLLFRFLFCRPALLHYDAELARVSTIKSFGNGFREGGFLGVGAIMPVQAIVCSKAQ